MDSSPGSSKEPLDSSASPSRPELMQKPSLLPAFEPLSSSPFPRPSKRKFEDSPSRIPASTKYYPPSAPTSSTAVFPSSPPHDGHAPGPPSLIHTVSALSERQPLGAVPTLEVPISGEPVLMGRSSNSSHHQLSANRLISRVHVSATYEPLDGHGGQIVIKCLGWNGAKVHCGGHVYQLGKGDSFSSDKIGVEIMLDVQDARALVRWPAGLEPRPSEESDLTEREQAWTEDVSPQRGAAGGADAGADHFASSPPPIHPQSPESPTPANLLTSSATATFIASDSVLLNSRGPVQVYEDHDSDSGEQSQQQEAAPEQQQSRPPLSRSVSYPDQQIHRSSFQSNHSDGFESDQDEENDPIVHSFGPFGENLLSRLGSTSFASATSSPKQSTSAQAELRAQRRRNPLRATSNSPHQSPQKASPAKSRTSSESTRLNESPIKNHVINQLAFSRLHSIPLSTIHHNLPAELKLNDAEDPFFSSAASNVKRALSSSDLKDILDKTPCVGAIERSGKDAAGKPLENEFYYLPEMDVNEMRREAVLSSRGGTGLRAVRKNHKQYYWKRPRH